MTARASARATTRTPAKGPVQAPAKGPVQARAKTPARGRVNTPAGAAPQTRGSEEDVAGFIERLGSTLADAGFPRLPARVFAALLAKEDGRMTASELAETLSVSPASVSGAVKYLASMHMLHREREPGTRRDVYVVRDDAWHDTLMNTRRIYEPFIRVIGEGVDTVGGVGTRSGARLSGSVDFLQFISDEMNDITVRWEQRRNAQP